MKKAFLITLAILLFTGAAHAQFTPYGSARVGVYFDMEDEDWSGVPDGTLNLNYHLLKSSIFGARYRDGDLTARVELGFEANVRLLWARYNMGSYQILVGKDATPVDLRGTMTYNNDNQFSGWGSIFDGRRPQIRVDMNNGLSLALVEPELIDMKHTEINEDSLRINIEEKQVLLPKINLGYKRKLSDNISLSGVLGVNLYNYGTDTGLFQHSGTVEDNLGNKTIEVLPEEKLLHDLDGQMVLSFIAGLMLDMKFNDFGIKLHGNFGQNTGNYGLSPQTYNEAIWNSETEELVDVTTMGGFGELSYKMSDIALITVGASYIMSNSDLYDNTDTAMAAFGQFKYQLAKKFWLIPELGMLDKMNDKDDNSQGSMFYFGTQLRMDF